MEYIISDTHFLHDNIWAYDLSRVAKMGKQIGNWDEKTLKKAGISLRDWEKLKWLLLHLDGSLYSTVMLNKRFIREIGDKLMIYNWNKKVGTNDTVYHLGDLSMASTSSYDELAAILSKLNGHIKLIMGNHDNKSLINKLASKGLLEVISNIGIKTKYNHRSYFLSHYGIDIGGYAQLRDYFNEHHELPKGISISIHGHIHEDNYPEINKFNVSVDNAISYEINGNRLGQPLLFSDLDAYITNNLPLRIIESIASEAKQDASASS